MEKCAKNKRKEKSSSQFYIRRLRMLCKLYAVHTIRSRVKTATLFKKSPDDNMREESL